MTSHHCVAEIAQALNDTEFSLPANAATYWVGEAMHSTHYNDLDQTPEKTAPTTRTLATNVAHLAPAAEGRALPANRLSRVRGPCSWR